MFFTIFRLIRYDNVTMATVTAEIIVPKRTLFSDITDILSDDVPDFIIMFPNTNIRAPMINIHIRPFSTPYFSIGGSEKALITRNNGITPTAVNNISIPGVSPLVNAITTATTVAVISEAIPVRNPKIYFSRVYCFLVTGRVNRNG